MYNDVIRLDDFGHLLDLDGIQVTHPDYYIGSAASRSAAQQPACPASSQQPSTMPQLLGSRDWERLAFASRARAHTLAVSTVNFELWLARWWLLAAVAAAVTSSADEPLLLSLPLKLLKTFCCPCR
jgi:hypothetical protein